MNNIRKEIQFLICLTIEGHERYHFSEFLVSKINYTLLTLLSLKSLAPPLSYLYPKKSIVMQMQGCSEAALPLPHSVDADQHAQAVSEGLSEGQHSFVKPFFYLRSQDKKKDKLWDEIFQTKQFRLFQL